MEDRPLLSDEAANGSLNDDAVVKNNKRRRTAIIIVSVIISLLTIVVAVTLGVSLAQTASATPLVDVVRPENILTHLSAFLTIANNGTIASRSVKNQYNQSAEYVISVLTANGVCEPVREYFLAPVHEILSDPTLQQLSPTPTVYQPYVDFQQMRYGGLGSGELVSGGVFQVPPSTVGCDAADYAGLQLGSMALVPLTSNCTTYTQAVLAQTAGASALLQYVTAQQALSNVRVRNVKWQPNDTVVEIPAFSISYSLGQTLRLTSNIQLALSVNAVQSIEHTYNVICDTGSAKTSPNVVVIGAHLDSVPEGPGINDNGSGSATILEIALQFAQLGLAAAAINPVKFCWWGAEEIGLLGSRYHVDQAVQSGAIANYALYLNFDMLGSPNFDIQVHKGTFVNAVVPEETRAESTVIQSVFEQYLNTTRQPYEFAAMTGGSDYLPFIEDGNIPSGGMATGASSIKSVGQRDTFGGFANAQLDPCYHQYCDDVGNVSEDAIRICSETASYVLQFLTYQTGLREFLQGSPLVDQ